MQLKSQILPKISEQSSFIHSIPKPIPLPYSPYPSFQAQCGAVRCDSCEVKLLDQFVFRGDMLPFNDSMTVCQWSLFMGVDDAWTCCLFTLCFLLSSLFLLSLFWYFVLCFVLCFGFCGLWQSCCMLVGRGCKFPVVKSVTVRVSVWILFVVLIRAILMSLVMTNLC